MEVVDKALAWDILTKRTAEHVAKIDQLRRENDQLREKLEAEVAKLIDENRRLLAEVSRSSYHCD